MVVAALAGAAILAGCGDDPNSPEHERIARAENRLADGPRTSPDEWAELIRASFAAANAHVDTDTGEYESEARGHFTRADAAWPWYVNVVDKHPKPEIAAIMVKIYGEGLKKPDKAAVVARMLAREDPSVASYLQWAQWSVRAGDLHSAEEAAEGAVERAKPADRAAVQERVDRILAEVR
jgi:hypothetical protein